MRISNSKRPLTKIETFPSVCWLVFDSFWRLILKTHQTFNRQNMDIIVAGKTLLYIQTGSDLFHSQFPLFILPFFDHPSIPSKPYSTHLIGDVWLQSNGLWMIDWSIDWSIDWCLNNSQWAARGWFERDKSTCRSSKAKNDCRLTVLMHYMKHDKTCERMQPTRLSLTSLPACTAVVKTAKRLLMEPLKMWDLKLVMCSTHSVLTNSTTLLVCMNEIVCGPRGQNPICHAEKRWHWSLMALTHFDLIPLTTSRAKLRLTVLSRYVGSLFAFTRELHP